MRELKGFQRVTLAAGAKQTLSFTLGPDELKFWVPSRGAGAWSQGRFDVWAGGDSGATLHGEFAVQAKVRRGLVSRSSC